MTERGPIGMLVVVRPDEYAAWCAEQDPPHCPAYHPGEGWACEEKDAGHYPASMHHAGNVSWLEAG